MVAHALSSSSSSTLPAPTLVPPSSTPAPPPASVGPSLAERHRRLGEDLDALKARTLARIGADDVRHVERLDRLSRGLEITGRVLIHISLDPITWSAGVFALWLHKQLQATEIGHTALHGAYDRLPGAPARFHSKNFQWETPIEEEGWRVGHNLKHHGHTNIAGKDPDVEYGFIRLTDKTPFKPEHRHQVATALGVLFPNFGLLMNLHFTGVAENPRDATAWKRALRTYLPYYGKEYGLFPLLAGPMFAKVLLGNWLAETMRDIYSAATIFCGHIGEDVASWAPGAKAGSRGEWYAMQIESANDFEVSKPISILCGGLDRQIEHHLFPTFPPERLREIAPEVKQIAEKHGFRYNTDTWPRTLKKAFRHLARLAREGGVKKVMQEMA